jgi:pimeloyl-ACP methyl ester carboxylesterase
MPKAAIHGIHIEYEAMGDTNSRPLLLIGGLADQLIHWDDNICADLVRRGHYVIRFDNRDAGLSTKCDDEKHYTLEDMAGDAVGLLDVLMIERAHVCGISMGGMIAQTIAIRHPSRLLSLISISSTAGSRNLPPPDPGVMELLLAPAPRERNAYIEYMLVLLEAMAGKGFAFDKEWTKTIVGKAYDRSFSPEGTSRQLRAVMSQPDRRKALASVRVPTLVIHGTDDPLVPMEAGKEIAGAIQGAELMVVEGMGHDLPHGGAWPRIVEAITGHTMKIVS